MPCNSAYRWIDPQLCGSTDEGAHQPQGWVQLDEALHEELQLQPAYLALQHLGVPCVRRIPRWEPFWLCMLPGQCKVTGKAAKDPYQEVWSIGAGYKGAISKAPTSPWLSHSEFLSTVKQTVLELVTVDLSMLWDTPINSNIIVRRRSQCCPKHKVTVTVSVSLLSGLAWSCWNPEARFPDISTILLWIWLDWIVSAPGTDGLLKSLWSGLPQQNLWDGQNKLQAAWHVYSGDHILCNSALGAWQDDSESLV